MFESQSDSSTVAPFDHTVFWMGVYLQPVAWVILGLGALFRYVLKRRNNYHVDCRSSGRLLSCSH